MVTTAISMPHVVEGLAVLVVILVGVCWRASVVVRRDAAVRASIPPLGAQHYRFTGADESLQAKGAARREIAARIKKRSALVASGSTSAKVLEIARRA